MSKNSPTGEMGQKYLASGVSLAMRLWENEKPNDDKDERSASAIMKRSVT